MDWPLLFPHQADDYAMKVLITIWICFLHTGQGNRPFFNTFAQVKQATRWAVLPWTMFPFRGLFWHIRQGFSNSLLLSRDRISSSSFCLHLLYWSKDCLTSHPCARCMESTGLLGPWSGLTSVLHRSLDRTIGAETVLRQSGTSIPSVSSLLWNMAILDVEREWTSLGQSENQSFRKAQQWKQYRLMGELNFLHLVHCQQSWWKTTTKTQISAFAHTALLPL